MKLAGELASLFTMQPPWASVLKEAAWPVKKWDYEAGFFLNKRH
jgi:hypothetical protein